MSLTIVTRQTSGQNETSDHLVQGIYREEKGGSYAAGFVDTPPSNVNFICFALPLGQPHNRCESASGPGNNTITLLSLQRVPELAKQ
ncbi:GTP-binding protein [Venturia inaequalis]|nr:GTP-binding protein [Venturia inaequalis]